MNRLPWPMLLVVAASHSLGGDNVRAPVAARAVAFSPDGKLLAAGFGTREMAGGLVVWDLQQQRALRVTPWQRGVSSLSFSPDNRLLAFSVYDQAPQVIEVASGETYATLADDRRGPVAFSADGRTLVTGCVDKRIPLWDVAARADRQVLEGALDRVYGPMALSADGRLLATPCGSAGVLVWDIVAARPQHIFKHGSFFSRTACFSPDGRWCITGGYDGTVRIWNLETGAERARFTGMGGAYALDYAPGRALLAVGSGEDIHLFELTFIEPGDELLAKIRGLLNQFDDDSYQVRENASAELVKLGFAAEAELARAAMEFDSAEVRIRARRARQNILSQPAATLTGHDSAVQCVALSSGNKLLASASDDGTVRVWDVVERSLLQSFKLPQDD